MEIPYPDNLLIADLTKQAQAKWPDGSLIQPTDTMSIDVTYADMRAILTALQMRASVRLALAT